MLARSSIRVVVLCWLALSGLGAWAQEKPSGLVVPGEPKQAPVPSKVTKTKTVVHQAASHMDATRAASPPLIGMHELTEFTHSPFPYGKGIPGSEPGEPTTPFYNIGPDQRRFHMAPRGGKLYEDVAYNDSHSFLYIPSHFDASKPVTIVLFLHGNLAKLERDVIRRQHVPQQLEASGMNAVLVAPQLAVDALDSSAGNFWQPGFLEEYLEEAATKFEDLSNGGVSSSHLHQSPVVIVAYSGGYLSTAYVLADAQNERRIRGVILLDALFGEEPKFARWIEKNSKTTFFVSAYSDASKGLNSYLSKTLGQQQISVATDIPSSIGPGMVILKAAPASVHNNFVTQAWAPNPLQVLLKAIDRGAAKAHPYGTSANGADLSLEQAVNPPSRPINSARHRKPQAKAPVASFKVAPRDPDEDAR